MNRHRIFLAGLLTLTLGFGLWVSRYLLSEA